MYGRLVKSGNTERFYASFYSSIVSNAVMHFEGFLKDAATLLSTKVADCTLAKSKEKTKEVCITTCTPLTKLSPEEEAGLQYLGGYVLQKLHKKLANSNKSKETEQAMSILKAGKSEDQAVSESQRLISSLNHGGYGELRKVHKQYFKELSTTSEIILQRLA